MWNKLIHSKLLNLMFVLLFLTFLTSCGIISTARNITKAIINHEDQDKTGTLAPSAPSDINNISISPSTPTTPILERALDEKSISLIADRLFIQMPAGVQDIARQQDIMAAPSSNQRETRLVLNGNGQELVVFAQETFLYTDNMEDDMAKILKSWYGETFTYTSECIQQSSDGFKVLSFSPDKIDTSGESALIRGAFVRITDGTMIFIGVYVTPENAVDNVFCAKQADTILKTIQPGTRKIDTTAHEETIENNISIKLDNGYILFAEPGADFIVYYIAKIAKLNESVPSIGIYVGGYPTLMYPGRGIDKSQLGTTKDTILNKNVDWMTYKPVPNKENYSAETVFSLPFSQSVMHIFVDAANEDEFLKIKKMIDTLKYK